MASFKITVHATWPHSRLFAGIINHRLSSLTSLLGLSSSVFGSDLYVSFVSLPTATKTFRKIRTQTKIHNFTSLQAHHSCSVVNVSLSSFSDSARECDCIQCDYTRFDPSISRPFFEREQYQAHSYGRFPAKFA